MRKEYKKRFVWDEKDLILPGKSSILIVVGVKLRTVAAIQNREPVTEARRRSNAGRPRHDLAAEIAKAIFENNPELIYKAYAKAVAKGNAYAYQVLAERAYGKLKESIQHEISPYRDLSDDDLVKRIAELERELGVPPSTPALLPPESDTKPN